MEKKNFLKELFQPENKKTRMNLFTIFIIGILLLIMGDTFFANKEKETKTLPQEQKEEVQVGNLTEKDLEKRLKEILSQIEGAGQVEVMVTLRTSAESVVAHEEKKEENRTEEEANQGVTKTSEITKQENTVVMLEDSKGNRSPFIVKENVPQVEGIVIVAQGSGNATVRNAMSAAAQALLDVPAHKIAILKMK